MNCHALPGIAFDKDQKRARAQLSSAQLSESRLNRPLYCTTEQGHQTPHEIRMYASATRLHCCVQASPDSDFDSLVDT